MKLFLKISLLSFFICNSVYAWTCTTPNPNSPITKRVKNEAKIPANYYGIAFYKPNYLLPYYYTGSPANAIYQGNTPYGERLDHPEMKFQISLKVPLWKEMFGSRSSIYLAYSQLSYWQAYNKRTFVRENDYEPEGFLANYVTYPLFGGWNLDFLNVGLNHQSNGQSASYQRGWNRLYGEAIASNNCWAVSVKPWFIISTNKNNNNIGKYLGYGRVLVSYKYYRNVISLEALNLIGGEPRHETAQLTWSFPITSYIKGYVQVFSGYGQSLIEYNHRTNSAGVGIALNDWI
jgi:phospholipase A1